MILPYILRQIGGSNPPVEKGQMAPAAENAAGVVSIDISGFKFSPAKVTVKKGTVVRWVNGDPIGHTITGDNGGPDSAILEKGGSYSYTFSDAGVFNYHCTPHQVMKGAVEVTN